MSTSHSYEDSLHHHPVSPNYPMQGSVHSEPAMLKVVTPPDNLLLHTGCAAPSC